MACPGTLSNSRSFGPVGLGPWSPCAAKVFTNVPLRKAPWSRHSLALVQLGKTLVSLGLTTTVMLSGYTTFGSYQRLVRGALVPPGTGNA